MTSIEHQEIINDIDINLPPPERLREYKKKLEKHQCKFDCIKYEDLDWELT